MLLWYLGVNISVDDFISVLPKADMIRENGILYGPDPNSFFAGSPYDEDSFGCYPEVILEAVRRINEKYGLKLKAENITGMALSEMKADFLMRDIPVLFWATIDMKPSQTGPVWKLNKSGDEFVWRSNEHCLCLTGFDGEGYYFNDPWENHGLVHYGAELVQQRHREMYEMAVVIGLEK